MALRDNCKRGACGPGRGLLGLVFVPLGGFGGGCLAALVWRSRALEKPLPGPLPPPRGRGGELAIGNGQLAMLPGLLPSPFGCGSAAMWPAEAPAAAKRGSVTAAVGLQSRGTELALWWPLLCGARPTGTVKRAR